MLSEKKTEQKRKRTFWFKGFLRTLLPQLLLFIVFLVVFGLLVIFTRFSFLVYGYAVQLCAFFWLLSVGFQWTRYAKRAEQIDRLRGNNPDSIKEMPEAASVIEEMYQEKYRELAEDYYAYRQKEAEKSKEQMDYFTLWLHQIKTPIAAISLMLQQQEEESPSQKQMEQELLRLNEYTHMALNYLKLEDTGKEMDLEQVAVDTVIKDMLKKYAILFIYNNIQLDYKPLDKTVLTDRKWLQVLLEQLLSNSLKYTKAGKISIYFEGPDTLVIEDTGSGIRKEDLPKVFEKGYTGLNGRLHEKSTGLGLFLSRKICRRLGHELTLESDVGKGTKAKVLFTRPEFSVFD